MGGLQLWGKSEGVSVATKGEGEFIANFLVGLQNLYPEGFPCATHSSER